MWFETGIYDFDLNQIDLSTGGEDTSTSIYEFKNRTNETTKVNNNENNNIKIEDIFFEKGGK